MSIKYLIILFSLVVSMVQLLNGQSSTKNNLAIPYEHNCKYGLMDVNGNIITKANFLSLSFLEDRNLLKAIDLKNRIGVINKNGKVIVPTAFDEIKLFRPSMTLDNDNNLKGGYLIIGKHKNDTSYFTTNGKRIFIKGELAGMKSLCGISGFRKHWYEIFNNGKKYGLQELDMNANPNGIPFHDVYNVRIAPIYDSLLIIGDFQWFIVKKDGNWGIIALSGDTLYKFGNYKIDFNSEIYAFLITDPITNKKGAFIDYGSQHFSLPIKYEAISGRIFDSYFFIKENDRCSYYIDIITNRCYKE